MKLVMEVAGIDEECSLLEEPLQQPPHKYKVTWCRYMPEFPDKPQPADLYPPYLLAVTLGITVSFWIGNSSSAFQGVPKKFDPLQ